MSLNPKHFNIELDIDTNTNQTDIDYEKYFH